MKCIHCNADFAEDSRFCPSCGADISDPDSGPQTLSAADVEERLRKIVEGQYEIKELLGRGGMAYVFLAEDLKLGRPVAIKVLPPVMSHDDKFVRRFHREARTSAQLDQPNIIPIYAVESERGIDYFVMKYVDGKTLEQILKETGALPIERCQQILWEAARGLAHAHNRGIIHRDVKPANVMIDQSGHVILTDFGISKALEQATQFTETGQIVGTPHYMSPEQAKGSDVDGRADQYSLAVVGYRMLTGRLPFKDDSLHTILYKHIFEHAPPIRETNPEVPEFLERAIHTALAKTPDHRFRAMEEFATAVWPEHPLSAPAFVPPPLEQAEAGVAKAAAAPPSTSHRRNGMIAALGGAALVIAGVLWVLLANPFGGSAETAMTDGNVTPTVIDTTVTDTVAPPAAVQPPPAAPPVQPSPAAPAPARTPPPQQVAPAPALPQVGYLTTNAVPWGTVSIDGVDIGDTPVRRHELPPGTYVLRITRQGYVTQVDTIVISAGNEERRRYTLTPTGQ